MIMMTDGLRRLMDELRNASAETYYHSINVKNIVVKMIKTMNEDGYTNYTPEQIDCICKGALLHDVGKLKVKNYVLTKAAPLTKEEKQHIRAHTKYGYEAIKDELNDDEREIVSNICLYHHERIDGSGYEHMTELPLYVQVVSICDAFAALYYDRIYRSGVSFDDTMKLIRGGDCGKFDGTLVDFLEKVTSGIDLGAQ